jgi:hypothetical protein
MAQGLLVVVFGSQGGEGTQPKHRVLQLGVCGVVNMLMPFSVLCEVFGIIGLVLPDATSRYGAGLLDQTRQVGCCCVRRATVMIVGVPAEQCDDLSALVDGFLDTRIG